MSARWRGLAPWSGLVAAATGWALHQQIMSEALHFDCRATEGPVTLWTGVLALLLIALGALVSWRARPRAEARDGPAAVRWFVANMSLMAAMLAALGIVFHMLAGAIVPGCRP